MWMGTYPDLPSYVLETGENLQDVLNANREKLIGKSVLARFGADLPFLPKILSISKALPLQIHPNKELSAELHKNDPDNFTDSNHKPEIAVVLSEKFEAFGGFMPLEDIDNLFQLEPLRQFLPGNGGQVSQETVRTICRNVLQADDGAIRKAHEGLGRLPATAFGKHGYIADLLPRLQKQYPKEDPGTLVALLCMNYMVLSAGDAIYIPADGIHAYLSGDIVECMARSNNMLNTGMCPRAERDSVELFTKTLTFESMSMESMLLGSAISDRSKLGKTIEYKPPLSEFNMLQTTLVRGERDVVDAIEGPSVLFVTSGRGVMKVAGKDVKLSEGYVFFVGQGVEMGLETEWDAGMTVYRAYAE